jgi:hypothetical protein
MYTSNDLRIKTIILDQRPLVVITKKGSCYIFNREAKVWLNSEREEFYHHDDTWQEFMHFSHLTSPSGSFRVMLTK